MTRKELAEQIYEIQYKRGIVKTITKSDWVNSLLNGRGNLRALKLKELQDWYEKLEPMNG